MKCFLRFLPDKRFYNPNIIKCTKHPLKVAASCCRFLLFDCGRVGCYLYRRRQHYNYFPLGADLSLHQTGVRTFLVKIKETWPGSPHWKVIDEIRPRQSKKTWASSKIPDWFKDTCVMRLFLCINTRILQKGRNWSFSDNIELKTKSRKKNNVKLYPTEYNPIAEVLRCRKN